MHYNGTNILFFVRKKRLLKKLQVLAGPTPESRDWGRGIFGGTDKLSPQFRE